MELLEDITETGVTGCMEAAYILLVVKEREWTNGELYDKRVF